MAILPQLHLIIQESELSFEEMRAFEAGIDLLTEKEQYDFFTLLKDDIELLYPLYIHFKAKTHAMRGTQKEWEDAVEKEIEHLEQHIHATSNT